MMVLAGGVVFAPAGVAPAESPSDAGADLYKRLDAKTLGETLQRLRMGALLEVLADETGDGQLKVEALLFQAQAADPEQQDERLAQAARAIKTEYETLGKNIEATPPDKRGGETFDEMLIAYFKLRLRYVQVQALQRGKPHIDRLTFLLGGESDRQALRTLVSPAMKRLAKTQRDLQFELTEARQNTDKTKMVYLVPELEDVQSQLDFTAGKLRYYAAMVLPETVKDEDGKPIPNPQRESLLTQAVRDLQRFADKPDYGVQSFAKLQQARANRVLGNFKEAAEQLASAAADQADPGVLVEALFEAVLNETRQASGILRDKERDDHTEAGNQGFARAEKALEEFRRRAPETGHPRLGVDVKALVLGHYLYEQWAEALRAVGKTKQADEYSQKSQQAFLAFLEKYKEPGVQAAVGRLFRDKFRGKDLDLKNLAPGIVLLLATMEMQDASDLLGGKNVDALDGQTRTRVEELLARAEEMLTLVRDNKSPEAQKALPDALWKLGVLYVQKNENFQAGEMFRQLVKDFPDHPRARDAALNAVKIANQLVAGQINQGKSVSPQRRLELVESIRVLLKRWPEDKEAAEFHFELAWQCEKLGESEEAKKRKDWLDEAITNYQSVPRDSSFYNEARFYALELLYQLLQDTPAGKERSEKAKQLQTAMTKFGEEMYTLRQKESNPGTKADLGRYGATSEFHSLIIAHDLLDQKDDALVKIEALSARWPGTPVLREGGEFAIRSRLARGDVQQALAQFEAFRKKYGDEQAQGLMQAVVEKLQQAILALSLERGKEEQLKLFRDAYAAFAKQVYDTSITGAMGEDKYSLTLLYADSLVQSGTTENARKALGLYESLQKTDAQRREEHNAKITAEFAELHKQAQAAKDRPDQLPALGTKLANVIKTHNLQSWENSKLQETEYLLKKLPKAKTSEKKDLEEMAWRAIVGAFTALEEHLLQEAPIDATVLLGLAQCHETLKQYPPAVEEYGKLARGLDPNQNARAYWEAQLGYCRSFLEAHKNNPAQMAGLLARVRTLLTNAPPRWVGKLNLIKVEAEKRSRKNRKQ
ncbi:MAG: tetratricopeptide repeat protein [Phycisphaerae bacterium]|nr:tetratricopeptide repeat protein [Phycisphaerae bacterium]